MSLDAERYKVALQRIAADAEIDSTCDGEGQWCVMSEIAKAALENREPMSKDDWRESERQREK